MEEPLAQLGVTGALVRAANIGVALLLVLEFGAARRARRRHDELAQLTALAQRHDGPEDLGDHVSGLAQHHGVADEHALALDLAGVVQGGHRDRRAADQHGFHHRVRGDAAGSPDVDPDVQQEGIDLLRRILERDGPPRRARSEAELILMHAIVDLDDRAVDLVLDVVAVLGGVFDEGPDLLQPRAHLRVGAHRQAPTRQRLVGLAELGELDPLRHPDPVGDEAQLARGGHLRILLAQGSGGAVAWIRKRWLTRRHETLVERPERLNREEHLPAHLKDRRNVFPF